MAAANNYLKIARYSMGGERVESQCVAFDDTDEHEAAGVRRLITVPIARGAVLSVWRPFAGLPLIGRGGGFP